MSLQLPNFGKKIISIRVGGSSQKSSDKSTRDILLKQNEKARQFFFKFWDCQQRELIRQKQQKVLKHRTSCCCLVIKISHVVRKIRLEREHCLERGIFRLRASIGKRKEIGSIIFLRIWEVIAIFHFGPDSLSWNYENPARAPWVEPVQTKYFQASSGCCLILSQC